MPAAPTRNALTSNGCAARCLTDDDDQATGLRLPPRPRRVRCTAAGVTGLAEGERRPVVF
ncbi:hypothetical protein BST28_08235 [Mycolicibacter kumamotonensis]|uniref:Uncharacterized protein n=1 Tax=Mycolicibacter kumamotonensis TaxID=354243 RepID=A0A1X0E833_9MYCO|nr:hypothetical protein [Mycolicibacter kumamotonensis]ORA80741.1 hypothetical protein BST28_08235 [Mycolicibacter kumamotonensis]